MSSKLKKKSKNKFLSKSDLQGIRDYTKRANNTDKLISDSYYNIKLIAFQILHDKFGFGNKRISRLDEQMDGFLEEVENKKISTESLIILMKDKYNVDVKAEANMVPFRERFAITKYKIHPESQRQAGQDLLASICVSFVMLGLILKTDFKFSSNQIKKAYWHIRDYINTLSRYKQFELTLDGIAESLMEDTKYCVKRFKDSEL
jgi:hypothetical protein